MERKDNHKPYILVSACLLGSKVRYDGKSKPYPGIERLTEYFNVIPVCPECQGGLPIPRAPSEIISGEKVMSKDGKDVSENYRIGAEETLKIAERFHPLFCILKERSPSCGTSWIHDGSFTDKVIPGQGITTRLLQAHGYDVYPEDKIPSIIEHYKEEQE